MSKSKSRPRRPIVPAVFALVACVIAACAHVASAGLPPGQHTATPKLWSEGPWEVTNYTPFQFDFRIGSLKPGTDHDLWFSVGSSIEHIDALRTLTTFQMPEQQWIVSGIAIANREVWFSAGQSGKVGIIDPNGHVRYVQVVPRRDFPDLRDLYVNSAGEMWFLDFGRSSIGYRALSGRVVENPFPYVSGRDVEHSYNNQVYVIRMAHCMGKFWVATRSPSRSELDLIDENLRPHPFFVNRPRFAQLGDIACDASDRLWLSFSNFRQGTTLERFDAGGHFKAIPMAAFESGNMAPDRSGGMWFIGVYDRQSRQTLLHFDHNSAMTTQVLPIEAYGQYPIAFDADQRLWMAISYGGSPIAVTELEPSKR